MVKVGDKVEHKSIDGMYHWDRPFYCGTVEKISGKWVGINNGTRKRVVIHIDDLRVFGNG